MKTLQPVREQEKFYKHIEDEIYTALEKVLLIPLQEIFNKYSYKKLKNAKSALDDAIEKGMVQYTALEKVLLIPLQEIFNKYSYKKLKNAKSALDDAIEKGMVQYTDGKFEGKFNSKISKELRDMGAKYSASKKAWLITQKKLPFDISTAIVSSQYRFEKMHKEMLNVLDPKIVEEAMAELKVDIDYNKSVELMEEEMAKTLKSISIKPDLNKEAVEMLTRNYSDNTNLYIKDFLDSQTIDIRKKVWDNTFNGYRASSLEKIIEKQYGTTKAKAKFLARQETSLLLSSYRQQKYESLGVSRYIWQTSKDERVRDRHAHLQGKVISWDEPPVTDELGNRHHAGEDFNCRCVARAIIE